MQMGAKEKKWYGILFHKSTATLKIGVTNSEWFTWSEVHPGLKEVTKDTEKIY